MSLFMPTFVVVAQFCRYICGYPYLFFVCAPTLGSIYQIYIYKRSTRKVGFVHRIYSYRNKKDTCVAYFDMMYYKNNTGAYLSSNYNNVGLPLYNKSPWPPLATVVSNLISQHIKCVYQHRNVICAICH